MAEYDYDEGGFMALYFLLTFLIIVLFILTPSLIPSLRKEEPKHCQCSRCLEKQRRIAKTRGSLLKLTPKGTIAVVLWGMLFAVAYKLATTKVESKIYDPFAILGLSPTDDEKAIKKHYKRLSIKFHPDKVKLAINQTIEEVSSHFVDLTKAYKALTDDAIRENLRLYGNPDGKQDFKVGIALPPWIIESANNGYVLGLYALLIGGALPYLVGRWWFSSRQFTKDGVKARTAETFFKSIKEEDTVDDVVGVLAKGWQFEADSVSPPTEEITLLEALVQARLSSESWDKLTNSGNETTKRALILLYAYFLRSPIEMPSLRKEQTSLLLHTPQFLTSLLAITLSHNWLIPTLHVMHLHAYLAQAIRPGSDELLQLPGIHDEDVAALGGVRDIKKVFKELSNRGDSRAEAIKKASLRWGCLEVLDLHFKVIGERIITPSAIVQLVFKLRLVSPLEPSQSTGGAESVAGKTDVDTSKRIATSESERTQAFLNSKKEAEDLQPGDSGFGFAHAPYWPEDRRPSWWVLVGDQKLNRVIVPPTRFTDVPYPSTMSSSSAGRTDRIYKVQFQAPPTVGAYTFQIHFVSDTFVVEDVRQNITLKIEDVSALTADEQGAEDEISDPEEDTIAGQMAAMRGGPVKKVTASGSDDDDESTTDGEQSSGSDSDSDSDSD